jgi:hypothetical protein
MTPVLPEPLGHPPSPPRWARVAAALLVAAALTVLTIGRGGTVVLAGVCLAFGALAVLLLSMPDRLPHEE